MDPLDLPARAPDRSVGALSVDATWVADKLSEYGFEMADLEALYPATRRRFRLKFSNTVRPFLREAHSTIGAVHTLISRG